MKAVLVSKEDNKAKFTMEFTAEEFDKATEEAYRANKAKFRINGFRPGKAPRSRIEALYGEGVFFEDALNNLLNSGYTEALDTLDLDAIDRPNVEFGEEKLEKGKGFKVTTTVDVAPDVKVKKYTDLKIDRHVRKITAKNVTEELEKLQDRNSRLVSVDRAAKKDDTVILDYAGFTGDEQFEGGTAENQSLVLGSDTFIPGFEDQLIGTKAGDEKDVKVTFPTEYHSEKLAGKEAVFKCKIHEVKENELPELNDDFAKEVSEFDTLADLKKDIKAKLEKTAKDNADFEGRNNIMEKLCELNKVELPKVMVEEAMDDMYQEFAQQIGYSGLDIDTYCKYLQKTPAEVREELRPEAENKVLSRLIIKAIAAKEKIEVSEKDIEEYVNDMAKDYGITADKAREILGNTGMGYVKDDIRTRKTLDFLCSKTTFNDIDPDAEKPAKKTAAKKETAEKKEPAKKAAAKKEPAKKAAEKKAPAKKTAAKKADK